MFTTVPELAGKFFTYSQRRLNEDEARHFWADAPHPHKLLSTTFMVPPINLKDSLTVTQLVLPADFFSESRADLPLVHREGLEPPTR